MRLTLLRNEDLAEGLANGQPVRTLPSSSWNQTPTALSRGADGSVHARTADKLKHGMFQLYFVKANDLSGREGRSALDDVPTYTATWQKIETEAHGSMWQVPVELGCASTIHKSQGSTEPLIYACLENTWAHGLAYVITSRTPLEENMQCIGVPPRDLARDIASAVWDARKDVSVAQSTWCTLSEQEKQNIWSPENSHDENHRCEFCKARPVQEQILHKVLHDKLRFR